MGHRIGHHNGGVLSGNYSFNGVVNGTYTVSASNTGVTFNPPIHLWPLTMPRVTGVNFTASVTNPLSISGTILEAPERR